MKRLLAALACALAIAAPSAARGAPCQRVLVVRDGKAFTFETLTAPGFSPDSSPTVAWCDGDLYPATLALQLLIDSKALELAQAVAALVESERANERAAATAVLLECQQGQDTERDGRLACERDMVPAPRPTPTRKPAWKRWQTWVGSGIAAVVVVVAVAAQEDHPLLWAAGGVGVGIVVGGAL